ncbi:MAG: NADH-quinone oxidoreductase subunit A [Candidatus Njordarchaeales archaeon]
MILSSQLILLGLTSLTIIILLILAIVLWKLIATGGLLEIFEKRATTPEPYKFINYECGDFPIGDARFRFRIEYYVFPLIFLLVDVFAPFLYLWAIMINSLNLLSLLIPIVSLSIILIAVYIVFLHEGLKLLTPPANHTSRLEIIEKAAKGDPKALEEFLRIEPMKVYGEGRVIEVRIKKRFERVYKALAPIRSLLRKLLGWLFRWGMAKSPWIPHFGIKCCAMEIPMSVGASRFDMERWGVIPPASPRQADILLVNGPVSLKLAPRLKAIYDQMPEPKFVIAVGECAIVGGPFKGSYSLIEGVNKIIPVDYYIPGCPPRPEMFLDVIMNYRKEVQKDLLYRLRKHQ